MKALLDQQVTVPDDVAALLTKDVSQKFPEWDDSFCRRGVRQMEGFLAACAVATEPLAPSEVVDEFWHAFIVRTVPYAEFCERVAGRFIHHVPEDDEAQVPEDGGRAAKAESGNAVRARTIEAIAAVGREVDLAFWPELSANCNSKCTQCYQGCTDSPKK